MANIALIKPPATYADWYKRPVLGLSYLAAVLAREGYQVRIFGTSFQGRNSEEIVAHIAEFNPDLAGITAMTHEVTEAAPIAAMVKKSSNIPVVIGGCHVTALPVRTLEEFLSFDYGIKGEGERPFLELLSQLLSPDSSVERPDEIAGLVYRESNGVRSTQAGSYLSAQELDDLPFPDFEQYYGVDSGALSKTGDCYVILSGRGCSFRCSFCMRALGGTIRRRSPESIISEIESAVNRFGAHTFDFVDEISVADNSHVRKLYEMLVEKGLSDRIRWSGLTRANLVNDEILRLAKRAGCYRLEMGVESGDDDILRRIKKGITVKQVESAVRMIKNAGISLGTYYIIGHPHETHETAQKTIDLAARLNTDSIAVGVMVPYPGTDIYEMAKRGKGGYRLLSEDWSRYDKYGGSAMELDGLSLGELQTFQKRAYLKFYIRNLRIIELAQFLWSKRLALYFLVRRTIFQKAEH